MTNLEVAVGRAVSRETLHRLQLYQQMVVEESERQNLVARSTLDDFFGRHIVDAAQLLRLAGSNGSWLDIGSGVGVPGLVLSILGARPVTLCEPRPLRTDFLRRVVTRLDLEGVSVETSKVERLSGTYDFITARAVASLDKLFTMALPRSHSGTRWILPKGRSANNELVAATTSWQGIFRTEPSLTDDEASIIIADKVQRRGKRA